jgi:hypothetical protein
MIQTDEPCSERAVAPLESPIEHEVDLGARFGPPVANGSAPPAQRPRALAGARVASGELARSDGLTAVASSPTAGSDATRIVTE